MSRIEEIRSAAQAHYPSGTYHEEIKVPAFIRGSRYADETMIEKACGYLYAKTKMSGAEISDFRKAMEE